MWIVKQRMDVIKRVTFVGIYFTRFQFQNRCIGSSRRRMVSKEICPHQNGLMYRIRINVAVNLLDLYCSYQFSITQFTLKTFWADLSKSGYRTNTTISVTLQVFCVHFNFIAN